MLALGAAYGFTAVVAGAYGAHVAKAAVAPELVATWRTANEYHFVHALALLAAGILSLSRPHRAVDFAAAAFALAVPVFSGSLYALVLTGDPAFGRLTPVGGTLMLAGWASLLVAALKKR